jgi:hypothetical protein
MRRLIYSIRAAWRFRGYKPKPLSPLTTLRWVRQFDRSDRQLIEKLLDNVIYFSEPMTRSVLLEQNAALSRRLDAAGIAKKKRIYLSIHDAGSSSPVMLNLLRDSARLEGTGSKMLDGRDRLGLVDAMNKIGEGALIYVDDFIGSGNQFCKEHDFISNSFVGTFSEFLIVPSICEEALAKLEERAIQVYAGHRHAKSERPLHEESTIFTSTERSRLGVVCRGINRFGLGYRDMSTMVVLYRNAPNTVPVILRGNTSQSPYFGVFPRFADLPPGV